MSKIYLCDSDFLIGLLNKDDAHHLKILSILKSLIGKEMTLYCPANIICEASTLLQTRLNKPTLVKELIGMVISGGVKIISVTEKDILDATTQFKPLGSKRNTLFDVTCLIIARKINADAIFSFEKYYKKNKFKTLADFI